MGVRSLRLVDRLHWLPHQRSLASPSQTLQDCWVPGKGLLTANTCVLVIPKDTDPCLPGSPPGMSPLPRTLTRLFCLRCLDKSIW